MAQDALHTLDSSDVDHGNEIVGHKNSSKMCVLVMRKSKHLFFVATFSNRKHGLFNWKFSIKKKPQLDKHKKDHPKILEILILTCLSWLGGFSC